jgi:hypothetical protein
MEMLKGELRNHTIETKTVKFQEMAYDHMEVVNRADKKQVGNMKFFNSLIQRYLAAKH